MLPATDPPNRQITLGCGAFLELLNLAACERGLRADMALWPEGEPQPLLDERPIARIRLTPDPSIRPDPLFRQITQRQTNRVAFDLTQPPSATDLQKVTLVAVAPLAAGSITAATDLARTIVIGQRGFAREMTTPATSLESAKLTRIGAKEIARHRDGISLQGPFLEVMAATGLLSREAMADPKSFATKSAIDMFGKTIEATPAFLWLKGQDNS
eukprot:gene34085-56797_t